MNPDITGFTGPQIPFPELARRNYGGEAQANPFFDPFSAALSAYGAGFPILKTVGASALADLLRNTTGSNAIAGLAPAAFGMYPNMMPQPGTPAGNVATTVGNALGGPASRFATRIAEQIYRNGRQ